MADEFGNEVKDKREYGKRIQDYSKFDPHKYSNEYYATTGEENRFLLEFYYEIYKNSLPDEFLLEFGDGPTVYQLLSAAQRVIKSLPGLTLNMERWTGLKI